MGGSICTEGIEEVRGGHDEHVRVLAQTVDLGQDGVDHTQRVTRFVARGEGAPGCREGLHLVDEDTGELVGVRDDLVDLGEDLEDPLSALGEVLAEEVLGVYLEEVELLISGVENVRRR